MSTISTHVLDTSLGRPAAGVPVRLERVWAEHAAEGVQPLGSGRTDEDGRLRDLVPDGGALEPGNYRLVFGTATYFSARRVQGFYPEVSILFQIRAAGEHYHVPLLLSPFGYSTYRGS
jgi:5-hydroxyisourate hydrolase